MKRFKIGQQVVCISTQTGLLRAKYETGKVGDLTSYYPKYGEIVTVAGYSKFHKGNIELIEYSQIPEGSNLPYCYPEHKFAPLMDISELKEILEQQPIHA